MDYYVIGYASSRKADRTWDYGEITVKLRIRRSRTRSLRAAGLRRPAVAKTRSREKKARTNPERHLGWREPGLRGGSRSKPVLRPRGVQTARVAPVLLGLDVSTISERQLR